MTAGRHTNMLSRNWTTDWQRLRCNAFCRQIFLFVFMFLWFLSYISDASADDAQIGRLILLCYHPTGHFRSAETLDDDWPEATHYNADAGRVIRIYWNGKWTQIPYETDVALLVRHRYDRTQIRTILLSDNAMVPGGLTCPSERAWVNMEWQ